MDTNETKNSEKGAFACVKEHYLQDGLTKREYFAGLALQGICVNAGRNGHDFNKKEKIAKASIELADALLKELSKTN